LRASTTRERLERHRWLALRLHGDETQPADDVALLILRRSTKVLALS